MNNKISLNKPPATITSCCLVEDTTPFHSMGRVSVIAVVNFPNQNEDIIIIGGRVQDKTEGREWEESHSWRSAGS